MSPSTWPAHLVGAALLLIAAPAMAGQLDRAVLDEINFARTHPAQYANLLREARGKDDGYGAPDPDCLDEAIAFMDAQPPLPPLEPDTALAASAAVHTADQGPRGVTGHNGADGSTPFQRIHRQGVWSTRSAEVISYGYGSAAGVVRQLIVDEGVPDRGHREIIFDPKLRTAGAGCGRHAVYGHMCVVDFAGAPLRSVATSGSGHFDSPAAWQEPAQGSGLR
jgi:hypothetical protein